MSEQQTLFSHNTIHNIRVYNEAREIESIGESTGINVKFTPTQVQAIKNIIKEHNMKASTFLREAMDFYIWIFPYKEKIKRHMELIKDLLGRLS